MSSLHKMLFVALAAIAFATVALIGSPAKSANAQALPGQIEITKICDGVEGDFDFILDTGIDTVSVDVAGDILVTLVGVPVLDTDGFAATIEVPLGDLLGDVVTIGCGDTSLIDLNLIDLEPIIEELVALELGLDVNLIGLVEITLDLDADVSLTSIIEDLEDQGASLLEINLPAGILSVIGLNCVDLNLLNLLTVGIECDVVNAADEVFMTKTPSVTEVPAEGGDVTYTVAITNDSDTDLTLDTLEDDVFGDLNGQGDCATGGTVADGATFECAFTGAVAGDPGTDHVNTITATLSPTEGEAITETASATVAILEEDDEEPGGEEPGDGPTIQDLIDIINVLLINLGIDNDVINEIINVLEAQFDLEQELDNENINEIISELVNALELELDLELDNENINDLVNEILNENDNEVDNEVLNELMSVIENAVNNALENEVNVENEVENSVENDVENDVNNEIDNKNISDNVNNNSNTQNQNQENNQNQANDQAVNVSTGDVNIGGDENHGGGGH